MTVGGIVLAGGRSSRMGTPKAALEWHGSTLLRRICGLVRRAVDGPVVVVRAPGQDLPPLPDEVEVLEDPREGVGPLQGLAVGLDALAPRAALAYLSATDVPFLHPAFIRTVTGAANGETDVVLPHAAGHPQPLAAVYRTALAAEVATLLAEDRLRPAFLFARCRVRRLDDAALLADPAVAAHDPQLASVANLNTREDYDAARAQPAPAVTIQRFGALARNREDRGPRTVAAATLGEAARGAGLELDEHVVAALNGDQITRDGELPLVAGDSVAFLAADAGG